MVLPLVADGMGGERLRKAMEKNTQIPFGALHAADARLWPRRLLRTGRLLRSRWSRGGVVTDAGEMQQQRQRQRQRTKQIPFGKDKQRGVVVRGNEALGGWEMRTGMGEGECNWMQCQ